MDMKEKNQQWWDTGTRGHMPLGWKRKSLRAGKKPEAARKGRLCQSLRYIQGEALRVDTTVTVSQGTEG